MELPILLDELGWMRLTVLLCVSMLAALSRRRPALEFAGFAVIATYLYLLTILWIYLISTSPRIEGDTLATMLERTYPELGNFPAISNLLGLLGIALTLFLGIRGLLKTEYKLRQRICLAIATLGLGYAALVGANTTSAMEELWRDPPLLKWDEIREEWVEDTSPE